MVIVQEKDGTIAVADSGMIVASNDENLLGQSTAENEVVQTMKQHTDSHHIFIWKMKEQDVMELC